MISDNTTYVRFSSKGQIVIPAAVRQELGIGDGTKAVVQVTEDGILIKPITKDAIAALRGILKRKGQRPLAEEWAEYKQEERELEEKKLARHGIR